MSVRAVNRKEEPKAKPSLKYLRDKMREKVTGIFRFFEVPGGHVMFNYREFKEDPIERYDMVDGETYTIPLGVARHLNRNCSYPEYGYFNAEAPMGTKAANPIDSKIMRIAKSVRRMSFQSLEFIDIDEFPTSDKQIVEVQSV